MYVLSVETFFLNMKMFFYNIENIQEFRGSIYHPEPFLNLSGSPLWKETDSELRSCPLPNYIIK